MAGRNRSCAVHGQIESLLQRNHSPRKFAAEHEYRLQQGFLTSSTQEVLTSVYATSHTNSYSYVCDVCVLSLSHSRSGGRVTAPIVSRKLIMRHGSVESM